MQPTLSAQLRKPFGISPHSGVADTRYHPLKAWSCRYQPLQCVNSHKEDSHDIFSNQKRSCEA